MIILCSGPRQSFIAAEGSPLLDVPDRLKGLAESARPMLDLLLVEEAEFASLALLAGKNDFKPVRHHTPFGGLAPK